MKENSKKVPDAPLKLFVKPEHAGFTSEWIDKEGSQHEGYNVWLGVADERTWGYDEYINLAKGWNSVKEEPEDKDGMIILVNRNFENPIFCDLDVLNAFCDNEETMWEEATDNYQEGFWTYFKDIVPSKLKKGGK